MGDDKGKKKVKGIRKKVKARVEEEAQSYPRPEKNNGKVGSGFVQQCLKANQLGTGLLYAAIHKDRLLFNNTTQEWMSWTGHYWAQDIMAESLASVEDVVDRLVEELGVLGEWFNAALKDNDTKRQGEIDRKRMMIIKKIGMLRDDKGRNACLKFARTCKEPIAIRGDEMDLHPWLIGCKNGIIDLRTGKFRDGRPDEYISMSSPSEWKGIDEPAEQWERFILEIQDGNEEMAAYIQRLLGYGITGLNVEHIMPVFWGAGRNGKGIMVEVLNHVLGTLSGSIQSELLLDQRRARSSAGASPDIMSLKGLRLAFASETDEGQKFSAAKVKWLTGGDQLVGRFPYDKYEVRFKPTHTLFLLTNNKPRAPGDDFAFWERMHLIPFPLSFVDREPVGDKERRADKYLAEKLKTEASGILAWLVRGCLSYQEQGVNPPDTIREETAKYRKEEDLIGEFLEEFCIIDEYVEATASALYDKFMAWFKQNVSQKGKFTQRRFGTMLGKRFEKFKQDGVICYRGLKLDPMAPDLEEKTPDQ